MGDLLTITAADDFYLSRAYHTREAPAAAETAMLERASAVVSTNGNRGRPAL